MRQRVAGQAGQIEGIGHLGGFVEVVDAPYQPALGVAPGLEILDMQNIAACPRMRLSPYACG